MTHFVIGQGASDFNTFHACLSVSDIFVLSTRYSNKGYSSKDSGLETSEQLAARSIRDEISRSVYAI